MRKARTALTNTGAYFAESPAFCAEVCKESQARRVTTADSTPHVLHATSASSKCSHCAAAGAEADTKSQFHASTASATNLAKARFASLLVGRAAANNPSVTSIKGAKAVGEDPDCFSNTSRNSPAASAIAESPLSPSLLEAAALWSAKGTRAEFPSKVTASEASAARSQAAAAKSRFSVDTSCKSARTPKTRTAAIETARTAWARCSAFNSLDPASSGNEASAARSTAPWAEPRDATRAPRAWSIGNAPPCTQTALRPRASVSEAAACRPKSRSRTASARRSTSSAEGARPFNDAGLCKRFWRVCANKCVSACATAGPVAAVQPAASSKSCIDSDTAKSQF
mmetsp:Transcript_32763/g.93952  ORF Transcript_32763/g.93952 Transcript_32763/m.93952 type:complete len:341 (-) Transcript_32763:155-1177(-)